MLNTFTTVTALALSTTAAFAAGHASMTGYGLGADRASLTVFTAMSAPDAARRGH